MSKKIGVIAEDKSDVAVVELILGKYLDKNRFCIKSFVGNGCGKLKQKCAAWANLLIRQGCDHVILIHDLDKRSEKTLRRELSTQLSADKFPNSVIVIPIEELEGWLLADSLAIQVVFKLEKPPKHIVECETVPNPKEHLAAVVWSLGKKRYLNTVHNTKISAAMTLDNLRRCSSFHPMDEYIVTKICQ